MSLVPTSSKELKAKDSSQTLSIVTVESSQSNKKKKVNVLDEDTFLTKLEDIIEKDFFPDLEKHKLQQAYYEAVRNNDYDTVQELMDKYDKISAHSNRTPRTPAFFDTPDLRKKKSTDEAPYANSEPPEKEKKTSVDKYLAQNTSEDNVSFEQLMVDAKKKEQSKVINQWLLEKERIHELKYKEQLMLQDDDHFGDTTKSLDSWPYKAKNTLMYNPEGAALTDQEELAITKKERVINHNNTRFNSDMLASMRRNAKSTASTPSTDNLYSTAAQLNAVAKIGVDGKEIAVSSTPKVKGYGFVDASPSPMPGRSFGDESPMMTWGEIDSTPFRLEGGNTPYPASRTPGGPEFKIPDVPDREKLLFDLEEKNSAARRKKKNDALKQVQRNLTSPSSKKTPTSMSIGGSTSLIGRINSMSPAAQHLLSSKLNIKTGTKSITNSPYTPKGATPKSSPFNAGLSSPVVKSPSSRSLENLRTNLKRGSTADSITDNLLKLPKMT